MQRWFHRLSVIVCGLVLLIGLNGCHSKKKEVRTHYEQREGEVHEEKPGDMIVE